MRAFYIITACRASSELRSPPPSSPCLKTGASGGGCGDNISDQIAAFFYQVVVALFWFYTFTLIADTKLHWWDALRESWHLVRDHGPSGHVALVLLAILGSYFPTGPAPDVLGLAVLVAFVGLSVLGQVVAYLEVTRTPAP